MDKVVNEYKVGIILVNYNGAEDTIECVESIRKSTHRNYTIIIVDNNSKEDDYEKLSILKGDDIVKIRLENNVGFAKGNNEAIKYLIANDNVDFVYLLNNDTIIKENTLHVMIKESSKDSNIGITSCIINYHKNKDEIWYAGGKMIENQGRAIHYSSYFEDTREFSYITGCSMLISMENIKRVGMLSEDYFLYFEDTDYCSKFLKNDMKLICTGKTNIFHKVSKSTGEYSNLYFYYMIRNRFLYIKNNINGLNKFRAYLYSFVSMVYKLLKHKNIWIIRGFLDFQKGKRDIYENTYGRF